MSSTIEPSRGFQPSVLLKLILPRTLRPTSLFCFVVVCFLLAVCRVAVRLRVVVVALRIGAALRPAGLRTAGLRVGFVSSDDFSVIAFGLGRPFAFARATGLAIFLLTSLT